MAGRSMPGSVFSANFAMAISAPVLPADTQASASPFFTALMAKRMEELRPLRSATEARSLESTTSSVWTIRETLRSFFSLSSSGRTWCSRP